MFDLMFEIELNENYEDNFHFRNIERAEKEAKERETFRKQCKLRSSKSSSFIGRHGGKTLTSKTPTRNHNGFDSKLSFASINERNDQESPETHRNKSLIDVKRGSRLGNKSSRIAIENDLL